MKEAETSTTYEFRDVLFCQIIRFSPYFTFLFLYLQATSQVVRQFLVRWNFYLYFDTKIILYCQYQKIQLYSIFVSMCADVFVCSCFMLLIFDCGQHSKCLVRILLVSVLIIHLVRILRISVLIIHSLHRLSYDRSIASFKASFSQNHFILSSVFPAINCFTRQILRKM